MASVAFVGVNLRVDPGTPPHIATRVDHSRDQFGHGKVSSRVAAGPPLRWGKQGYQSTVRIAWSGSRITFSSETPIPKVVTVRPGLIRTKQL